MFEMLGRPPEHLKDTMVQLLEVISKENGIKIINKKIHEPKKVENKDKDGKPIVNTQGEIFSTFSESEIEFETLSNLITICFKYLPSHIEITYPENFNLTNRDFMVITNEILTGLHHYDAIAKSSLMNNQLLAKKLQEIAQNPEISAILNKEKNKIPLQISYGKQEDNKKGKPENREEKLKGKVKKLAKTKDKAKK